jgi:hypothetical protein
MINNKIPLDILKKENKFTLDEIGAVFVMMNQSELGIDDLLHWTWTGETGYADIIDELIYSSRVVIKRGTLRINPPIADDSDDTESLEWLDDALKDDHVPTEPPKKYLNQPAKNESYDDFLDRVNDR